MTPDGDAIFFNGPMTKAQTTQPLIDTVRQRLYIKLKSFKGDWFINTEYGIPYFQNLLGFKIPKASADLIFQTAILEENGVKEITSFTSTLSNRQYTLKFSVRVMSGEDTGIITVSPTT